MSRWFPCKVRHLRVNDALVHSGRPRWGFVVVQEAAPGVNAWAYDTDTGTLVKLVPAENDSAVFCVVRE